MNDTALPHRALQRTPTIHLRQRSRTRAVNTPNNKARRYSPTPTPIASNKPRDASLPAIHSG